MKRFNSASCVVLVLVAILGLTRAVAAGHEVPIKGTLEGIHTATGVPPIITLLGGGTGHATQLGNFTYDFPHTVNFVTQIVVGAYTFTAANGDTLIADVVEGSSEPVEPGVIFVVEELVITGGTGRFANASGEITISRLVHQSNFSTTGSFEGTISSPGGKP